MPPRPFPFALRLGIDIVSQARIRDVITKPRPLGKTSTQLDAFLRRVFTEREQFVVQKRFPGFDSSDTTRLPFVVAYLAGRWAAKEAAIKAIKPRKLTHQDVEILQRRSSREVIAIIRDKTLAGIGPAHYSINLQDPQNNSPAESEEKQANLESQEQQKNPDDASAQGQQRFPENPAAQVAKISISHDGEYATAVCLAAEDPIPGDVGGEATARLYSEP